MNITNLYGTSGLSPYLGCVSITDSIDSEMTDVTEEIKDIHECDICEKKKKEENEIKEKEEKEHFLQGIRDAFEEYRKYGARSSKKVDRLHANLVNWLKKSCEKYEKWTFELEKTLPSCNASGEKRCDIVAMYDKKPRMVFPVKFIMSNYNQNKNNNWEVLTGECTHLKWANKDLHIVPINIIFNCVPYLDKSSKIKKWEEITYEKSFKIIDQLKTYGTAYDTICYIIDVEHVSKVGEPYDKMPLLIGFNKDTPYRSVSSLEHFWLVEMIEMIEKIEIKK